VLLAEGSSRAAPASPHSAGPADIDISHFASQTLFLLQRPATTDYRRRQTNHSESIREHSTVALYTNASRRWVSTLSPPDLQRARSCTDFSQWAERGGNFRARSEQEHIKHLVCAQNCHDGLSLYGTHTNAYAHSVRQTALILLPNRSPAGIPGHWAPSAH
jgi:hypothetical protein